MYCALPYLSIFHFSVFIFYLFLIFHLFPHFLISLFPLFYFFYFFQIFYLIDTPSNSKMLSMLLHSRGLKCDVADNGLNAVEIVEDRGDIIDFVFMDFTMPIMVSLDLCTSLVYFICDDYFTTFYFVIIFSFFYSIFIFSHFISHYFIFFLV